MRRPWSSVLVPVAVAILGVGATACGSEPKAAAPDRPDVSAPATSPVSGTIPKDALPTRLSIEVVARYPHDTKAFTEGLLLDDQGRMFESTGRYGHSSVREVDVASGEVQRHEDLDREWFGEGLAEVDGRLIQLTYREHTAFVYDAETFEEIGRFSYDTEGWGLCYDGTDLVMSDGSSELTFRDPDTFEIRRRVTVTEAGSPRRDLNELECVDGHVYANQFGSTRILEIDPTSGVIVADADASGLLTTAEAAKADVLNGIAYDPGRGTFLITGKDWPWIYEVRFVPA